MRTWASVGTGRLCAGCGEPIERTQIEYEALVDVDDKRGLSFHLVCVRTWQAELQRRGVPHEGRR